MKVIDINPHIRFAEQIFFRRKPAKFNVFDCRIFCIVSGEMEIEIENCQYVLKESDLFYCAGSNQYTISCENGCQLLCLNFDLSQERNDIIENRAPFKINGSNPPRYVFKQEVEDCEFLNAHLVIENDYSLNSKVKSVIKEFENKQIFFREKSSAMLKDILIEMHRTKLKKSENSTDAIQNVISYINANFQNKIINSDLAKLTGYHEYYLNRIFKKQIGMTIHKYILQVRINEAKKMLMTTDENVSHIAEIMGFNSVAHFSSCFKNYFGYSPFEYKNNFKNRI